MSFTQKAIRVIKSVSRPDGFNVGLNLGKSAGGSLAEHLHMHVVPRWSGTPTSSPSSARPRWSRSCCVTPAGYWRGNGRPTVSDFYLMTRAAYSKLSVPLAKGALKAGLTPDTVTIIGTAGRCSPPSRCSRSATCSPAGW